MIIIELLAATLIGVLSAPIEITGILTILILLLIASIIYNDIKR